jgi:MoxR-like ATPase
MQTLEPNDNLNFYQADSRVAQAVNHLEAVRNELSKVIVGQEEMMNLLLTAILADGHVLIEGVPGVAKTLTAKCLAKLIDADFGRIQFTPDLMPSDVIGTNIFNPQKGIFEFKKGPIFGNIILIDEINRSPAKTQAALFEVMEERQITSDGEQYAMEAPFMVLATQNPIEHEGTYRLPEAQLDRFLFKINIHYPTLEEEVLILSSQQEQKNEDKLSKITPLISKEEIAFCRAVVQSVKVEQHLLQYIAQLIHETRNHTALYLGASPRASIALLNASKALAVLSNRDFITPEDVRQNITAVLRHRIVLSPEKEMEGYTTDDVITEIVNKVEVPR